MSEPVERGYLSRLAAAQIKNPDKGPSLRTGHSLVVVGLPNNPKAVIIGGCTAEGVVNEVWNLKLGVEMLEWESPKIGQPDKAPSPRWRHTATLLRTLPTTCLSDRVGCAAVATLHKPCALTSCTRSGREKHLCVRRHGSPEAVR